MAHYTLQCSECNHHEMVVFPITQFDERMKEERAKPCPKCSKENTLVNLIGNPSIVYRGDGWVGKIGTTGSQSRIDAALAENDRLQDASKTDRAFKKKEDEFRRAEEQAQEMAVKANGVGLA